MAQSAQINATGNGQPSGITRIKGWFQAPATPGILLILATVLALAMANSPLAEDYHRLFQMHCTIGIGDAVLSKPLHLWINDGLMAIFFFVIGLEIKRELLIGHLSSLKRSALPIAGAIGGMLVPALIYVIFNSGMEGARGWAIPMATDIAFALGVLSLLGNRIPLALKIFLMALAIVDDLGAVLVIALFYTDTIVLGALGIAGIAYAAALLLNIFNVRAPLWYLLVGMVVWVGFLQSGIHPTVAGVLLGLTIPVRRIYDGPGWLQHVEGVLAKYRTLLSLRTPNSAEELGARQEAVHLVEEVTEKAQSPLIRLEHALQPWVAYAIMPIFAFTNAGVTISTESFDTALASPVAWGVFLGLVLGKQIGVFLLSWLAVRLGIADMPGGIGWRHLYGVSILAGIGFTMSLFITELSFAGSPTMLDTSKLAILGASLVAGILGYLMLHRLSAAEQEPASGT